MSTETDTTSMTDMTDAELANAGRIYDVHNNEGGDGYNPYKDEAVRRDHARAVAEHEARLRTPEGRIEELQRRLRTECGSVARDCGNREEIDALERDLYAQIDAIKAEIDNAFGATWTREVTIARRAAWNAMVNAGKFGRVGGRTDYIALQRQIDSQGWGIDDLKRAVRLHNL